MHTWPLYLCCLLIGLTACDSILSDDVEQRVVGVVLLATEEPVIVVPDTVQAGVPFSVSIQTGWINTCSRIGDTHVAIEGAGATITPRDLVRTNTGCGDAEQFFTHTVELEFVSPGPATIVFRGRASWDAAEVLTFERQVLVQ